MGPVYPIEWQSPTFRGDYPHFAKRDAPVWSRWLALNADRFDAFAYDVALGGLTAPADVGTDDDRKAWRYLTALKIDAVALTSKDVWIIEVRPSATVSALGSVMAYTLIAQRDQVFDRPIIGAIVCEAIQTDVEWACEQLHVPVFKV